MLSLPAIPIEEPAWLFALLALLILIAPPLARRVRMPDIVGLVLVGTLIGPSGLGLLEREGVVETLGTAGLLYLMFVAGLELDLLQLAERRRDGLIFGVLTFVIPMAVSIPVILLIGFDPLAAVLLASCWASHTLLTYPAFRRFGVANNRAVAASIGATILTDTAALVVLVIVARAHTGSLDWVFWPTLALALVALAVIILWALPRLAQWVFTVVGRDRTPRLIFLLFALFGSAALAEFAGIEGIIGAFLAGLALNRLVPVGSVLMDRVEVLGNSILIPLFLVSVGMLVDPALLWDPATVGVAAVFTALALVTKWAAAEGAGRWLRFDTVERRTMFALSGAQAAATLAAVFIGLEVGLLGTEVVNPVVLVILATSLVSSWVAERSAPRLPAPPRSRAIGQVVAVPIANPASSGPLAELAAAIARRDGGMVIPVTVLPPDADHEAVEEAERLGMAAEQAAMETGVEAHPVTRVDRDPLSGILHSVRQAKATLLILGWKGESRTDHAHFGALTDAVAAQAPVPTLIARVHRRRWSRVVITVAATDLEPRGLPGLHLALTVARCVTRGINAEVVVQSERKDANLTAMTRRLLDVSVDVGPGPRTQSLRDTCTENDLVLVPTQPDARSFQRSVARLARELPDIDIVAAIDHRSLDVRFQAGHELMQQFDEPGFREQGDAEDTAPVG